LCDIAHENTTPVSFEAARWSDADLDAYMRSLEQDRERCPSCRLHPDAAKHVNAVIDSCPTCEARDFRRKELGQFDRPGAFVRWLVIDDPDEAASSSAWAMFTPAGSRARKRHEAGLPPDPDPDD
jgi:hypothetical protein